MKYGPEIQVDGKRPAWLADDVVIRTYHPLDKKWFGDEHDTAKSWFWPTISKIRLTADHWANAVIEQGFEPWAGSNKAPDDWDAGDVLLENGRILLPISGVQWKGEHKVYSHVIGYRKKGATMREKMEEALFGYVVDPRDAEIAALKAELEAARAKYPDLVPDPDRGLKDEICKFSKGKGWIHEDVKWQHPNHCHAAAVYAWEKRRR